MIDKLDKLVKEAGDAISSTPTLVSSLNETSHDPHEVLAQKEAGAAIRSVLNTLSDEHREVVLLREVDGLNYDQISEAVGIPKGTVMSRLHYARKMLQKALKDFAPSSREPLTSEEESPIPNANARKIFHSAR
jgi:RNA polymerase sigma factor (sigma-70 family)